MKEGIEVEKAEEVVEVVEAVKVDEVKLFCLL
jgi:hypothetical protein